MSASPPPPPRTLRLPARRSRNRGLIVLVLLSVLVLVLPTLVRLLAEWPWFSGLGYGRVFTTRLVAGGLLGLVVGGISFAFLYANLRFAQRGVVADPFLFQLNPAAPPVDPPAAPAVVPPVAEKPDLMADYRKFCEAEGIDPDEDDDQEGGDDDG